MPLFGILSRRRIGSRLRNSLSGLGSSTRNLPSVSEEDGLGGGEEATDSKPQEVEVELHEVEEEAGAEEGGEVPEERESSESSTVGPIPVSTGPDPMETEL